MAIDVTFRFLEILVIREASKREGVAQAGSARKETVGVELAVAASYFNSKRMSM